MRDNRFLRWLLIGWLFCSVVSYRAGRSFQVEVTGHWTRHDRAIGIALACAGPITLGLEAIYVLTAYKEGPATW
jgi:hypothetical protein